MKREPLISVVIPVYNAGGYLADCLESVTGQTYRNIEVILVDDGSTDNSSEFCDDYVKKDARFSVIHQKNKGAAAARKTGVLRAKGEYICFVDADDAIDSEFLTFFAENMGECDLLTSGYRTETAPGQYELWLDLLEEGIYATEKEMKYFLENMIAFEGRFEIGIQPYLCGKFYRTAIIGNVINEIDTSIIYSEDRDLLFRYILMCKSIKISHQSFYDYRYNPASIMHTVNKNFMSDLNKLYLSLEKAFLGHPQEECLKRQLQLFLASRIYIIPVFMGFSSEVQLTGYVFPFSELAYGSRVVLYGAGTVGIRYYRQICRLNLLKLVLWADKNWKEYEEVPLPVASPEKMTELEYDYIIIAVKRQELAEEIRQELFRMGVERNRILWRPPAIL